MGPPALVATTDEEVVLAGDGWPRGHERAMLPERGRSGPSRRYDLSGCVTEIRGISIAQLAAYAF